MITTDNSLDVAIEGTGFFQVLLPDGRIGYTRNGSFSTNEDGVLTTASGYVVQPEIAFPAGVSQINISRDGIVSVLQQGAEAAEIIGQLTIADFTNRIGLQPVGESFYVRTDSSGDPIVGNPQEEGLGRIIQGSLEASNVNVVQELVEMIETQRAYEVSSKTITSVDEMLRFISNNL
jgi:flagellar basal-body rod protein FlgG